MANLLLGGWQFNAFLVTCPSFEYEMRNQLRYGLCAMGILLLILVNGQVQATTLIKHKGNQVADRVIAALDSLSHLNLFAKSNNPSYPIKPTYLIPDLAIEYKLAELDNESPVGMDFTPEVRRYIQLFAVDRHEDFAKIIGLARLYFPIFEGYLDRYHLPLELKYLAIVESALNPLAVSSSGAVGLWQFKINTARMLDLKVTSYVDDRMDVYKSTDAACRYLQYLFRIFRDWHLALAAYNGGPGAVRNAILRSGGETNFWKLLPYLPEQTQNYIPAFIAATFVAKNFSDFNFEPVEPMYTYAGVDTVQVYGGFYLDGVKKVTRVDMELLRFLNPSYRTGYVPDNGGFYTLVLPHAAMKSFLLSSKDVYDFKPAMNSVINLNGKTGETNGKQLFTYVVRSGDYYHKLALAFGCTVDDILGWNPDATDDLAIGERLKIWADSTVVSKFNTGNAVK